jgi:hypothetical protein
MLIDVYVNLTYLGSICSASGSLADLSELEVRDWC